MMPTPFYLLSVVASTLLAFFTAACAVEFAISFFPKCKHRFRSLMRMLPLLAVPLDLVLRRFCISNWINPLSCSSCLHKFILEILCPPLSAIVSLINHLPLKSLSDHWMGLLSSAAATTFLVMTLLLVLRKLLQMLISFWNLRRVANHAVPSERSIVNVKLNNALRKHKVEVLISQQALIPLATFSRKIYLPEALMLQLTQNEFEAVLAHELEHLKWRDPTTRFFLRSIAAFFWWVPSRDWLKKWEADQETACDQSPTLYGIASDHLATALVKATKGNTSSPTTAGAQNAVATRLKKKTHPALLRLQQILGVAPMEKEKLLGLNLLGVALGALILITCAIWM